MYLIVSQKPNLPQSFFFIQDTAWLYSEDETA